MANTAILEHGAKIAAAAAILAIGLAGARSVAAGPEATPSPAPAVICRVSVTS